MPLGQAALIKGGLAFLKGGPLGVLKNKAPGEEPRGKSRHAHGTHSPIILIIDERTTHIGGNFWIS
ncbi:MAG: hypothetical protein EBY15_05530 [Gammaproteobacteria bacterium]|nr:hypothetical protein [Gammaproteobacteria bacterium]NDE56555.1 hypothetical protein [Gammaproteobacteria bacterium]NDG87390.1 hypothetical protein [Gammaproteobacteria bacterium]